MKTTQPRKQRARLDKLGFHIKRKMVSVHLSGGLRGKYKKRSIPVRKGDEVKILRGSSKGKTGKISKVDLKKLKVYVEGITRKKTDGTVVFIPVHPSNLMITELDTTDPKRMKASSKVSKPKIEDKPKPKMKATVEKKTTNKKKTTNTKKKVSK